MLNGGESNYHGRSGQVPRIGLTLAPEKSTDLFLNSRKALIGPCTRKASFKGVLLRVLQG